MRLRGADQLNQVVHEINRLIDIGFRGFWICDEGLLWVLHKLRQDNVFPRDIKLKLSTITGHGNPASAKIAQMLGADSFNPTPDLELSMIASLRKVLDISLDILICNTAYPQAMPPTTRFNEAAEIVRIASPVYLKLEPDEGGPLTQRLGGPSAMTFAREKVRMASFMIDLIKEYYPKAKISAKGPKDLAIPY